MYRQWIWCVCLLCLGFAGTQLCLWQWHKASHKAHWQANNSAAVSLEQWQRGTTIEPTDTTPDAWLGQQLVVSGRFLSNFTGFLDNQLHEGQAGLDVLGVLQTDGGEYVLINRGWVPWTDRNSLPDIQPPEGHLTLQGTLYPFSRPGLTLGTYPALNTPSVRLPWADRQQLQQALGLPLLAAELRVAGQQPQMFLPHWQLSVISPAKHRAYAWQWAALTLLAWGYALWIVCQAVWHRFRQRQSGTPGSNC